MWIRQGSFVVAPGKLSELRDVYNRDCAPIVRSAAGNIDCYLMESVDESKRCVVCTVWKTEEDAKNYEASGSAMEVVGKVRSMFAFPPVLESFRVLRP